MITAIFTNLANWRPRHRFTRHDLLDVIFVCVCCCIDEMDICCSIYINDAHLNVTLNNTHKKQLSSCWKAAYLICVMFVQCLA